MSTMTHFAPLVDITLFNIVLIRVISAVGVPTSSGWGRLYVPLLKLYVVCPYSLNCMLYGQNMYTKWVRTIFVFGLSSSFSDWVPFFLVLIFTLVFILQKNNHVQPALGVVADCTLILGMGFKSQHKILIFFSKLMTAGIVASMNG